MSVSHVIRCGERRWGQATNSRHSARQCSTTGLRWVRQTAHAGACVCRTVVAMCGTTLRRTRKCELGHRHQKTSTGSAWIWYVHTYSYMLGTANVASRYDAAKGC